MKQEFLNKLIIEAKINILNDRILQQKSKEQIIMETYRKHISEIDEKDTNHIYYYAGTFKDVIDEGGYYESCDIDEYFISYVEDNNNYISKSVPRDDPEAEYRVYVNVEGLYSYKLSLEEADDFEKNHIIIYDENAAGFKSNSYWRMCNITEDFVIASFKEGQKEACKLILKKYNTK